MRSLVLGVVIYLIANMAGYFFNEDKYITAIIFCFIFWGLLDIYKKN